MPHGIHTQALGDLLDNGPVRMILFAAHDLAQYGLDGDLWGVTAAKDDVLYGFGAYLKEGTEKPSGPTHIEVSKGDADLPVFEVVE